MELNSSTTCGYLCRLLPEYREVVSILVVNLAASFVLVVDDVLTNVTVNVFVTEKIRF